MRDAANIGINKSSAARALTELIDNGFLRVTRWSAFRLKTKESREWELTAEPVDGRPATKDFMRFQAPPKIKTRSPQRDTRSPQRDSDHENDPKKAITVPPAGPSVPKSGASRSPQRDTSNIPCGSPRFGDLAKEERTARAPRGEEEQKEHVKIPPSRPAMPDERAVKRYWLMRRALAEANRRMQLSDYFRLEDELHTDGNYEAYLARGTSALPKLLREFFEEMFTIVQTAAPPLVDGRGAVPQQGWMPLPLNGGATRMDSAVHHLANPPADSPSMRRCEEALERAKAWRGD